MATDNLADGLQEKDASPAPVPAKPVSNRPGLLQLGGEENFDQYLAEFSRLYTNAPFREVRGKLVDFRPPDCRHVCFKSDEDNYAGGRRDQWNQDRAEHLPWIGFVLSHPNVEIRPNKVSTRINYLLRVAAIPALGLEQAFYIVMAEPQSSGHIAFITAFPLSHHEWSKFRQEGAAIWPVKPKKKKGS